MKYAVILAVILLSCAEQKPGDVYSDNIKNMGRNIICFESYDFIDKCICCVNTNYTDNSCSYLRDGSISFTQCSVARSFGIPVFTKMKRTP